MDNTVIDDQFHESDLNQSEEVPKVFPIGRFLLLTIASFNLYLIYWFYTFWRHVKAKENSDIMPVWRAIFGAFFSFSLIDKIQSYARSESIPSSLNSMLIGVCFLVINGVGRLPEPYWMFTFLAPLLFLQPVSVLNEYCIKKGKDADPPFKWGEITILVVGGILIILVVISTFFPE